MILLSSADFFSKSTFSTNSFKNIISIKVSNGLDSAQDRHSVGPDLNVNCLQRLCSSRQKLPLARSHQKLPLARS